LEVAFARLTGGRRDRKGLLLLPLCPVYGLGACAIVLLPPVVRTSPLLLFLLGGAAAAAVEYLVAVFYEEGLGVQFWDYSDLPWNLQGRVCVMFALVWGAMGLALVKWVHPLVQELVRDIPAPVSLWAVLAALADLAVSSWMMRATGGRECLQWYRFLRPDGA
jgi:uncharacterized membrane protein